MYKTELEKFVSALYFLNSEHRLMRLISLARQSLLKLHFIAKLFNIDTYSKLFPELIVEINEKIARDLELKEERNRANKETIEILINELEDLEKSELCILSYLDWEKSFKSKAKNKLGIPETELKSYLKNWRANNLPGVEN